MLLKRLYLLHLLCPHQAKYCSMTLLESEFERQPEIGRDSFAAMTLKAGFACKDGEKALFHMTKAVTREQIAPIPMDIVLLALQAVALPERYFLEVGLTIALGADLHAPARRWALAMEEQAQMSTTRAPLQWRLVLLGQPY